jgi:pimeloyl-ACP methyl ester carboxylesterase
VRNLLAFLLLSTAGTSSVRAQDVSDFITPTPLPDSDTLVIGFLGGLERWDDANRSVRKVALALRSKGVAGLHTETFANRNMPSAVDLVRRALDSNLDGLLDARERVAHTIVAYGQSLGGAAAIRFARRMNEMGIPVALTVQVDSVGLDDAIIPPNVSKAANFYQAHRFTVRGQPVIIPANPLRTRIIENTRLDYSDRGSAQKPESWLRRRFGGAHALMEADPVLWARVEFLILKSVDPNAAVK